MAAVDTRVVKVESDVAGLADRMQANFDRIFQVFEARNGEVQDAPRKAARTHEDLRGGDARSLHFTRSTLLRLVFIAYVGACAACPARGGSLGLVQEVDFEDLIQSSNDATARRIAFVNPSTHKGHMDRLMDANAGIDLLVVGESNHTEQEMKTSKLIPLDSGAYQTIHQAWTPPVRSPGDHHTPGRASAGVAMASTLPLTPHPLETPQTTIFGKSGRCLLQRIEIMPTLWVNIFGIYAPAPSWTTTKADTVRFISELATEVLTAPEEMSLLIGDFNIEYDDDPVSQALQARGVLLDVAATCADNGARQPATYRTKAGSSAIDRALCTPSLLRWITGFKVCLGAGTGAHLPILIDFAAPSTRPPAVLTSVLEIPRPDGPVNPATVVHWQTSSVERFTTFMAALDNNDVDSAHHL
eukprot:812209-Amphidinium_carterae.1